MKNLEHEKEQFERATKFFDNVIYKINNNDFGHVQGKELLLTLVVLLYWNMKATALLLEDKKEHEVH